MGRLRTMRLSYALWVAVLVGVAIDTPEALPLRGVEDSVIALEADEAVELPAGGVSAKSCKDLGWFSNYKRRTTPDSVCAATDKLKGGCQGARDFESADSVCRSNSGRLCTSDELWGMVTAKTGCDYDAKRVWSSTPCGTTKFYTMSGRRDLHNDEVPKECTKKDQADTVYVRCC